MFCFSVAAALSLSMSYASAAVIDFDPGASCVVVCGNGSQILTDLGSIPGQLTVTIQDSNESPLLWWGQDYSDLSGVAYASSSSTADIFFAPAPGFSVTVSSFQLGAWPNTNRSTQTSVLDGLGNVLFESGRITVLGMTASTFSGPWTSADGVRILFGPDSFNVGIDNIMFDVTRIEPVDPTVIPLPAPVALLGSALLGLAAFRRRA